MKNSFIRSPSARARMKQTFHSPNTEAICTMASVLQQRPGFFAFPFIFKFGNPSKVQIAKALNYTRKELGILVVVVSCKWPVKVLAIEMFKVYNNINVHNSKNHTTSGDPRSPLQAFLSPVEFPAQTTLSVIAAGLVAFLRQSRRDANLICVCCRT